MTEANVVNIVGGLGNQLFQYLFGLALEEKSGRPTLYDVSDFAHYKLHGGLAIDKYFALTLPVCSEADLAGLSWPLRGYRRRRVVSKIAPLLGALSPICTDDTFCLDAAAAEGGRPRYFRGYWQSEPYGPSVMAEVRRRLNFSEEVVAAADRGQRTLGLDFEKSAAIQVRRGDYMNVPKGSPHYGLPLDHYYRAMDHLADNRGIERFYVFSDDVTGLRAEFLTSHNVVFVDGAVSSSAGVDLCLLARFSHIVISNSTFGWWAAALREDQAGIVLAPVPWLSPNFRGDQGLHPMIFSDWVRFEVFPGQGDAG